MLRSLFSLCFILFHTLFCFGADFDVVVIGTSPISLLEALYRYHSGSRVLILEEAKECGGAWKSLAICGVPHADLGCHTLGKDANILSFLQDYVGCKMVSMDKPELVYNSSWSPNGYYPSKGCHEMIGNLLQLIEATDIVLLSNTLVESVYINSDQKEAVVKTKNKEFSTTKILVTSYTGFKIDNLPQSQTPQKTKYYHVYLLIEDATAPRFSYHGGIGSGMVRMMNLTPFVDLLDSGHQLVVIQTSQQAASSAPDKFLEQLKKHNLIDNMARIVRTESYIYEQSHYNQSQVEQVKNAKLIFERLNTNAFNDMASYIPKWKNVLQPFHLAILHQVDKTMLYQIQEKE